MLNLLITGKSGRMGQALLQAADATPETTVTATHDVGEDLDAAFRKAGLRDRFHRPFVHRRGPRGRAETRHPPRHRHHRPQRRGTRNRSARPSKTLPIVFASNYSVGVNTLFWLTRQAARILTQDRFDIEVVEMHHKHKIDSPSGTARTLLEILNEETHTSYEADVTHGRLGNIGPRKPREIGMHTLRGGDVVGDHTVIFAADGERVELTHKASSRMTFASGAVRAAVWLQDKPAGLYDMQDVLGLEVKVTGCPLLVIRKSIRHTDPMRPLLIPAASARPHRLRFEFLQNHLRQAGSQGRRRSPRRRPAAGREGLGGPHQLHPAGLEPVAAMGKEPAAPPPRARRDRRPAARAHHRRTHRGRHLSGIRIRGRHPLHPGQGHRRRLRGEPGAARPGVREGGQKPSSKTPSPSSSPPRPTLGDTLQILQVEENGVAAQTPGTLQSIDLTSSFLPGHSFLTYMVKASMQSAASSYSLPVLHDGQARRRAPQLQFQGPDLRRRLHRHRRPFPQGGRRTGTTSDFPASASPSPAPRTPRSGQWLKLTRRPGRTLHQERPQRRRRRSRGSEIRRRPARRGRPADRPPRLL